MACWPAEWVGGLRRSCTLLGAQTGSRSQVRGSWMSRSVGCRELLLAAEVRIGDGNDLTPLVEGFVIVTVARPKYHRLEVLPAPQILAAIRIPGDIGS